MYEHFRGRSYSNATVISFFPCIIILSGPESYAQGTILPTTKVGVPPSLNAIKRILPGMLNYQVNFRFCPIDNSNRHCSPHFQAAIQAHTI